VGAQAVETCHAMQVRLAEEDDVGFDGVQPARHSAELQQAEIDSWFRLAKLERVSFGRVKVHNEHGCEAVLWQHVQQERRSIVGRGQRRYRDQWLA
jgi:hypothetical protein